jgi:ubiquinone/menaquinone biosynthesis C-methylase UbiE
MDLGAVFDAAHVEFAVLSPLLWDPAGAATVECAALRPGERVLDVCCGAGASALPAASAVGPTGRVDAIDLADALLDQGRALAAERGLDQLHFTKADATTWPTGDYDVVQCVYGVFFLPDMDAGSAYLVSRLRPGGRFVVTTCERSAIAPVPQLLVDAIRDVGAGEPPVAATRSVGARINNPADFTGWLAGLGLRDITVTQMSRLVPMDADIAWTIVQGAAMRGMLMGLSADMIERVRRRFGELFTERGVDTFNATSLIGIGRTAE